MNVFFHFNVAFVVLLMLTEASSQTSFEDCDTSDYYATFDGEDPNEWNREQLHNLISTSHRKTLPYTDRDGDDVWKALIDIDGRDADSERLVRLVYADTEIPAVPFGEPDTWNREHIWPKSRGVEQGGKDFTDVHHLRPSDWNVNAARGNTFFGICGLVANSGPCNIPANDEAASDTSSDGEVWLPPEAARGLVARSILYMELRYDGDDGGLDLVLTDCPSANADNEMAFLSQLLEWHSMYPPDDVEKQRNERICQRWQGNRNPFVDYPELAESFFGKPKSLGKAGYDCNNGNAPSPAPAPQPNSTGTCDGLQAGDVMVFGFNSDNPDVVALVSLSDLPPNMPLFITDNAWTGSSFLSNEGILQLNIPPDGISAGTVFGFHGSDSASSLLYGDNWDPVDGSFALAAGGDTIIVYCESETGGIVHLSGLSYSGEWVSAGSDFETSESALPSALANVGSVALSHMDNYKFVGEMRGSTTDIQNALGDPINWSGSNSERFSFSSSSQFELLGQSKTSNAQRQFSWNLLQAAGVLLCLLCAH